MATKGKKMLMWAAILVGVYFFWDKVNGIVTGAIASVKSKVQPTSTTTTNV